MWTSAYYNYWGYWELRHKVTFDGPNKLIIINNSVTELDVQTDIYSDWKEWLLLEDNTKYLQALNTVGGEPTVAGQRLDVTYFLINGWKIKPYPGSYDLNIVGNIFDLDGGSIKVSADINPLFPNNININTNTSVIVRQVDSTGGTGVPQELQDAIYNIEDRVISIQNILQTPVTASLIDSQALILTDIQEKMIDMWRIHGLDINNPVVVDLTSRVAGPISQSISTVGSGSLRETTITRD